MLPLEDEALAYTTLITTFVLLASSKFTNYATKGCGFIATVMPDSAMSGYLLLCYSCFRAFSHSAIQPFGYVGLKQSVLRCRAVISGGPYRATRNNAMHL